MTSAQIGGKIGTLTLPNVPLEHELSRPLASAFAASEQNCVCRAVTKKTMTLCLSGFPAISDAISANSVSLRKRTEGSKIRGKMGTKWDSRDWAEWASTYS